MPKTPDAALLMQVEDVRMCYSADGKGPLVLDGVNVSITEGRSSRCSGDRGLASRRCCGSSPAS